MRGCGEMIKGMSGKHHEYLVRDPGVRGVVDIGEIASGLPAREPLRVLDGLGGVLGHELVEPGDRAEGGEAAAADANGVGAVAAPGARVPGRLVHVDLGEGRVVAIEQLGDEEEPHRPRPNNREPGCTDEPPACGNDKQGEQLEELHVRLESLP